MVGGHFVWDAIEWWAMGFYADYVTQTNPHE